MSRETEIVSYSRFGEPTTNSYYQSIDLSNISSLTIPKSVPVGDPVAKRG